MGNPARFRTVTVLVLLTAAANGAAQESARGTTGGAPKTGTSPATTAARITPASGMRIRVYEGFGTLGPLYDQGGVPPYAVDVGVAMTACPDGNTEISSLEIGGWQYELGTACQEHRTGTSSGSVAVRTVAHPPAPAGKAPAAPTTQPHVIRCNPNTWNCVPTTR
jgi:hypothetical protein